MARDLLPYVIIRHVLTDTDSATATTRSDPGSIGILELKEQIAEQASAPSPQG